MAAATTGKLREWATRRAKEAVRVIARSVPVVGPAARRVRFASTSVLDTGDPGPHLYAVIRPLPTSLYLALSLAVGCLLAFPGCGGADEGTASEPAPSSAEVGARAPDFSAPDQSGQPVSLASLRGSPVVLYFYPRDATPGCTAEACAFRDAWDRLEALGAKVVGVSSDDAASHAEFAEEHGLSFPLLADTDGAIADAYGVPSRFGFHARMTFIIDASGVIRRVFRDVDPAVHVGEVSEVLESLAAVSP